MRYPNHTPEEVKALGEQIYATRIRGLVEADNKGRFVVIDVETGEYEMGDNDIIATQLALAKRPSAMLYHIRIGYPTAYNLGGRMTLDLT